MIAEEEKDTGQQNCPHMWDSFFFLVRGLTISRKTTRLPSQRSQRDLSPVHIPDRIAKGGIRQLGDVLCDRFIPVIIPESRKKSVNSHGLGDAEQAPDGIRTHGSRSDLGRCRVVRLIDELVIVRRIDLDRERSRTAVDRLQRLFESRLRCLKLVSVDVCHSWVCGAEDWAVLGSA